METSVNITLLVISAVILINAVVSLVVLRISSYSPKQRLLQLTLIWLIPLLGAGICAAFASFQPQRQLTSDEDPFGSGADNGDGVCGCNSGGGGDGAGSGEGGGD